MSPTNPTTPSLPVTRAKRRALIEEQRFLDRVHQRVEQLRERASERAKDVSARRSGPTFQAQFERDVQAHHHALRAARYTFGDVESLAFGRLDREDGEVMHIGRVSVVDDDRDVLLVDWRAPAAAPFYQATAAHPLGVARRRTLVTRGRELRDLDDEIVDAHAAAELGLDAVTGQGALLAALSRDRAPQMRDIVATIQAEQDRIIRAPATGTLIVTGGPGTGKTVVALHRVASLLYRDRARFEGRGVLVVGPSRVFTEYTARVLPALGEAGAVQRPLAALAPREADVEGWDPPSIARIKGTSAMIGFVRRLLAAVLPPIPPEVRFSFEGTTVRLAGGQVEQLRRRHLGRVDADHARAGYHARRAGAEDALQHLLWDAWRRAHTAAGNRRPDDADRGDFADAADEFPQVRMLHRCFWPQLDILEVAGVVHAGVVDVAALAHGLVSDEDAAALAEHWAGAGRWTVDDVAFLDEVAALLGPVHVRDDEVDERSRGIQLGSDELHDEVVMVDIEDPDYRDFAHVVVDEAQDLTPMLWRSVARRAPYASWTVVGDLAQRSRLDEPETWQQVAQLIGRRHLEIAHLDVNYRTPTEIAVFAADVLAAAGGDPHTSPRSVRATGQRPVHLVTGDIAAGVRTRVGELLAAADGTVAVLCPQERLTELGAALDGLGSEAARVRVLDVRTAKGLEFDDVVVADPDRILAAPLGAQQLYVAVTRATRTLTLVTGPGADLPGQRHCERRVTAGRP